MNEHVNLFDDFTLATRLGADAFKHDLKVSDNPYDCRTHANQHSFWTSSFVSELNDYFILNYDLFFDGNGEPRRNLTTKICKVI